jgi:glycosyltransferase involved in cell wall biosynthesis
MTRISIVIPCYNAAKLLPACLDSALAQTGAELDVIVVDDGSTDDTLAVAQSYGPPVRALTGPNQGVSRARNRGIAASDSGDWMLFLDADDILLPGSLAASLAVAGDADVVICDWMDVVGGTPTGKVRSISPAVFDGDAELAIAISAWAPPLAILYRRALVDRIGGFRPDFHIIQDARFLLDAARLGAKFVHAPHLGAHYFVLPDSQSRRHPGKYWRDILLNGIQIEAMWRSDGRLDAAHRDAVAGIINHAAQGLFNTLDPAFLDAIAALRSADLPVSPRNRLAERLTWAAGQKSAARLAAFWRLARHGSTKVKA